MSNRLASEKSPYLLQHKNNPVGWWPWGDEALALACKMDRPILLSIGYATCHWCHVMERESFEDPDVARLMNEAFVNIKVDREERPDIDAIYMGACQVATGRGGWPLTIFMTPQMRPFFAGTYLPKTARYGQPGLLQIIPNVAQLWRENRSLLEAQADDFTDAMKKSAVPDLSGKELSEEILHEAFRHHERSYDSIYGGSRGVPKFPSPEKLRFLLRYWYRTENAKVLEMVENTLQKMRRGGIYDQLGGGFHRYSTDEAWKVPHFEKMLYDQALLILTYLEAFQVTANSEYLQTVQGILKYVHRELQNNEGAYSTGEDADSEGVEGKYYVWTMEELRSVLSPEEAELARTVFNLEEAGNYLDEATRKKTGLNILYLGDALADHKFMCGISRKLFEHRRQRIRPLLDDKVLTDWNGLMITALARCGMVLKDCDLIRRAERCVRFFEKYMMPAPGKLLHRWREGEAGIAGFLDDYAYVIMGLLALYEATDQEKYGTLALSLTRTVLDDFRSEDGDFFMVAQDGESLLLRPRQLFDSAIPSGSAVMMINLLRLGRMTGDSELEAAGHHSIQRCSRGLSDYPEGFSATLSALDYALGPSTEIILSGSMDASETQAARDTLRSTYAPNAVILSRPDFGGTGEFAIHMCHGSTCEPPTQDADAVMARITRSTKGGQQ